MSGGMRVQGAGVVGALKDFKRASRTAGDLSLNSTTFADVSTSLDLVLAAAVGDVIEYGVSGLLGTANVDAMFDVATIVGGSPVSYFSGGASSGMTGWYISGGEEDPLSGYVMSPPLVAGDISSGTVTLRLRYKTGTASTRALYAQAGLPFSVWAKNLGQVNVGTTLATSPPPRIKRRVRDSLGDITTTSTTMVPIDATNLAYVTFDLAVGDLVELALGCVAANTVATYYVGFDFEVDRPISANVYASGGQENGVALMIATVGNLPLPVTALATFVVTEAGTHGFRPAWRAEGNTAKIFNGTTSPLDLLVTFVAKHWPAALVG